MRRNARAAVAGASVIAMVLAGTAAQAAPADDSPQDIFDKAAPATVNVIGKKGSGSGFVYDADQGLIVTNAHVVAGEDALKAVIPGKGEVPVQVLGSDPCEDVAVLKLSTPQDDLEALEFGDSDDVNAGDQVTALGYPASFQSNVEAEKPVYTSGAVQSPNVPADPSPSDPHFTATIQHSATLNPGNSGGPLLDSNTEVVGLNTLQNPDAQGQYYSISSRHVRSLLKPLADGLKKNDPGWQLVSLEDQNAAALFTDPDDQQAVADIQKRVTDAGKTGLLVYNVVTDSPAGQARLEVGDVIMSIKDTPVATMADLCDVLQSAPAGSALPMHGMYTVNEGSTDEAGHVTKFGEEWDSELRLSKK
ncbi:S1C family serine protease [Streptomyces griseosporeus]|uniref:S1C family serine protease n=1 Tax=Streptomyces griseosporeus TaxID=1910 RepID=UPI0036F97A18